MTELCFIGCSCFSRTVYWCSLGGGITVSFSPQKHIISSGCLPEKKWKNEKSGASQFLSHNFEALLCLQSGLGFLAGKQICLLLQAFQGHMSNSCTLVLSCRCTAATLRFISLSSSYCVRNPFSRTWHVVYSANRKLSVCFTNVIIGNLHSHLCARRSLCVVTLTRPRIPHLLEVYHR